MDMGLKRDQVVDYAELPKGPVHPGWSRGKANADNSAHSDNLVWRTFQKPKNGQSETMSPKPQTP